jgi:diaminopimelate epimerase
MRFSKLEGCKNDYVFVDRWDEPLAGVDLRDLAIRISDRHAGVGGDGLILIGPSTHADARMEVYNADGSIAEMCGNGLRCAAKLAWDNGRLNGNRQPRFETGAGILTVELQFANEVCNGATVRMGRPRLTPDEIPVQHPGPGPRLELQLDAAGQTFRVLAVGMGNPHAVCFVPDADALDLTVIGPALEHHAAFPRRTNVEFVSLLPAENGLPVLRQRTWERGSGETMACGTGACAVVVAAILDQRIPGRSATVRLSGGDLHIEWANHQAEVVKTGPAQLAFTGHWPH